MGFLLGADTHQDTEGDKATNEMGIFPCICSFIS